MVGLYSHQVSAGEERSSSVQKELKGRDGTEDANLDGNPDVGANARNVDQICQTFLRYALTVWRSTEKEVLRQGNQLELLFGRYSVFTPLESRDNSSTNDKNKGPIYNSHNHLW